jgi:hypothetical protein
MTNWKLSPTGSRRARHSRTDAGEIVLALRPISTKVLIRVHGVVPGRSSYLNR